VLGEVLSFRVVGCVVVAGPLYLFIVVVGLGDVRGDADSSVVSSHLPSLSLSITIIIITITIVFTIVTQSGVP
jgi:hypothetical protein